MTTLYKYLWHGYSSIVYVRTINLSWTITNLVNRNYIFCRLRDLIGLTSIENPVVLDHSISYSNLCHFE